MCGRSRIRGRGNVSPLWSGRPSKCWSQPGDFRWLLRSSGICRRYRRLKGGFSLPTIVVGSAWCMFSLLIGVCARISTICCGSALGTQDLVFSEGPSLVIFRALPAVCIVSLALSGLRARSNLGERRRALAMSRRFEVEGSVNVVLAAEYCASEVAEAFATRWQPASQKGLSTP